MDPVQTGGSMDPIQRGGPWTWGPGFVLSLFISLIRMRSKRDIKMGRLCTPGGAVLGIVGGGVRFRFLNGEAIFEEYMLFWVRLYALVVVLKILLDFSL